MSDSCSSRIEASRRAALASLGRRSAGAPAKVQAIRELAEGRRQLGEHGQCTCHKLDGQRSGKHWVLDYRHQARLADAVAL